MQRVGRRRMSVLVAAVLSLLLVGCVGIPTEGPIGTGEAVAPEPGSIIPLANDPDPEASPEEIVAGFLSAAAAGLYDDFTVARKFLTLTAASGWDPRARVVVYEGGGPRIEPPDGGTVAVTVPVEATLDKGGRYTEAAPSAEEEARFRVEQDTSGQWRISELDDGVLISRPTFDQLYRQVPVYFASRDRKHLVPDVRWFPNRNQATSAVEALLAGPSPWLRDAVVTGAPEGARLSSAAVTVNRGVAQVELTAEARLAGAGDRGLLLAQLDATLQRLPGVLVNQVQVSIAGVAAEPPVVPQLLRDPAPAPGPYLLREDTLWLLERGTALPVEGVPPLEDMEADRPAAGYDGRYLAVRDGRSTVVLLTPGAEPVELLNGRELVAPSFDRFGWVWSGERGSDGTLLAGRSGGAVVEVAVDWLDGRSLRSVRVSRDGSRVALVSSGPEGPVLDVAAVVRDDNGTPRLVGQPLTLAPGLADVTQVVWVDEATVAVLGADSARGPAAMHLVPVGGPTRSLPAVEGAVGIAAGRGDRALYVLTEDGVLFLHQNQSWGIVAEDVQGATYPG
jgi:hypothetical protein